jgi:hypothetical protein
MSDQWIVMEHNLADFQRNLFILCYNVITNESYSVSFFLVPRDIYHHNMRDFIENHLDDLLKVGTISRLYYTNKTTKHIYNPFVLKL